MGTTDDPPNELRAPGDAWDISDDRVEWIRYIVKEIEEAQAELYGRAVELP